jgi:hypothetical protein
VYVVVGDVVDTEIVVLDVVDVVVNDGVRGVVMEGEIVVVEDELVNDIDFGDVIEVVYLVICVQRVIVGEWREMLRQISMKMSLLVMHHCHYYYYCHYCHCYHCHCHYLRTPFRLSL